MLNQHVIGKIGLDFRFKGGQEEGFELQSRIARLCEDELLPALEQLFDRLCGPDEVIALDSLNIDVSNLDARNWRDMLIRTVLETVEQEIGRRLSGAAPGQGAERTPLAISHFAAWLHFLEYGNLPLPGKHLTEQVLNQAALDTLAARETAVIAFLRLLRENPVAQQRLLATLRARLTTQETALLLRLSPSAAVYLEAIAKQRRLNQASIVK